MMERKISLDHVNATKVTASVLSILGGLASIGHGIFEVLQGNVTPNSFRIEAIGPAHRFWEYGGEPALTIIPNYLITGILAITISILIMLWAILLMDNKNSFWSLILLTCFMLLFGGGLASPTFMILAIIAAFRINKPVKIFDKNFPAEILNLLSMVWPFMLLLLIILVNIAIVAGIFGYPLLWIFDADTSIQILRTYGLITTFGIGPVVILSAFAFDVLKNRVHHSP